MNGTLHKFVTEQRGETAPIVAIVAAHPDDEVIGAGGQLLNWSNSHVIYVTDGVPKNPRYARAAGFFSREDYAATRRAEARTALSLAGIPASRAQVLGFVDQEVSWQMAELAEILAEQIARVRPDYVVTHPYEGGHPDHDAVACSVYLATERLHSDGVRPPAIVEMTSYHESRGAMVVGEFVPCTNEDSILCRLSPTQQEFKRRLFECYKSQREVLRYFAVEHERFRVAPRYDFTKPPRGDGLYYERFDWGMKGALWRDLARRALQEVGACV